jgi:hypothetical protein
MRAVLVRLCRLKRDALESRLFHNEEQVKGICMKIAADVTSKCADSPYG